MTDPTDHDELVSAYLDDEVTDEERARVENDPELLARVEALRAVADAVGRPVGPVEDHIAAAQRRRAIVAGADRAPAGRTSTPVPQRKASSWLPAPAAAAAVIVVLALVGVLLIVGAGGGSSDDTAGSPSQATSVERDAAGGGAQSSTTNGAAAADAEVTVPDLGSFADEGALRTELEAIPDVTRLASATSSSGSSTRSSTTVAQEGRIDRCDQTVQAQGDLSTRLAIATAELDGVPVLVFSHPVKGDAGEEPRTQLTVVDAADCRVLFAVLR